MEGGEVLVNGCLPSVSGLPLAFVPGNCPNTHWKGSLSCGMRAVCPGHLSLL